MRMHVNVYRLLENLFISESESVGNYSANKFIETKFTHIIVQHPVPLMLENWCCYCCSFNVWFLFYFVIRLCCRYFHVSCYLARIYSTNKLGSIVPPSFSHPKNRILIKLNQNSCETLKLSRLSVLIIVNSSNSRTFWPNYHLANKDTTCEMNTHTNTHI